MTTPNKPGCCPCFQYFFTPESITPSTAFIPDIPRPNQTPWKREPGWEKRTNGLPKPRRLFEKSDSLDGLNELSMDELNDVDIGNGLLPKFNPRQVLGCSQNWNEKRVD